MKSPMLIQAILPMSVLLSGLMLMLMLMLS
jgi:hypothetical protein